MNPVIPVIISCLALFISGLTAWLTLLRKGTVRMTQPTVVYFGPDGGHEKMMLIGRFSSVLYFIVLPSEGRS
jgi:hypothetical protein